MLGFTKGALASAATMSIVSAAKVGTEPLRLFLKEVSYPLDVTGALRPRYIHNFTGAHPPWKGCKSS